MLRVINWQLFTGDNVITAVTVRLSINGKETIYCGAGNSTEEAICDILSQIDGSDVRPNGRARHRNDRTELSLQFADGLMGGFATGDNLNANIISAAFNIYRRHQSENDRCIPTRCND